MGTPPGMDRDAPRHECPQKLDWVTSLGSGFPWSLDDYLAELDYPVHPVHPPSRGGAKRANRKFPVGPPIGGGYTRYGF